MPKILVRKCPKTGKLFQSDAEYRKYIRALRKRTNITRATLRNRKLAISEVRSEIARLPSIEKIEAYVTENFSKIMIAYNGGRDPKIHAILNKVRIEDFKLDVSFMKRCSNTHCAPRNGEMNWGGYKTDQGVPRGYPGFSGNISYRIINNPERIKEIGRLCMQHNDALKFAGIHTGGGGGRGDNRWGYGVTLFLDDFEGLKKMYFKNKLSGKISEW